MLDLDTLDLHLLPLAIGGEGGNAQASCVDWYGNARPIFIGDRTFALMGYELVEGRVQGGRINEVRRLNFAPSGKGTP
ncbi:hypothetical protein [Sphingomonas montana]|uniref:hypothetical protein n=1 Tax=Sphingomonas montana TaxID=1843236 RepID=UPI0019D0FC5C|nr:hypothetical protein [Sphingomonas montana]